jgi:hypothetical protein
MSVPEFILALKPRLAGEAGPYIDEWTGQNLESGWLWIFTPVKSIGTMIADSSSSGPPFYYVVIHTYGVIDLRVLAAQFVVIVLLGIVIPFWICRRSRFGLAVGMASALIGLAFPLSIGMLSGGQPIVSLLYYFATAILCVISIATITLAHSRKPASR